MTVRFGKSEARLAGRKWKSDNKELAAALSALSRFCTDMPTYLPDPEFWLANCVIEKIGFGEIIDYEPPIGVPGRVY